MLVNAIFYCTLLIAIAYLCKIVKKRRIYVKIIAKIPGPPLKPIFGHLHLALLSPEEHWLIFRRWGKEYYPIYRMWLFRTCIISIVSPEDAEVILTSSTNIKKGYIYNGMRRWLETGLLTSHGQKWQKRRKILTPTFHFSILTEFVKVFTKETEILVKKLEKECDKHWTDVVPFISECTLKTITETAMGTQLNVENRTQKEYIDNVYRIGEVIRYRACRPWLIPDILHLFSANYRREKKAVDILHRFSKSVIRKRMEEFKSLNFNEKDVQGSYTTRKRMAMLDLLIKSMTESQEIDENGIREEVDTFMFEGHDTTATSLCFSLMLLACHQDVQEKVREEIRDTLGEKPRELTLQDMQSLPYLEMVIKESLRLYPSVPLISRVLSEPVTTSSGYYIPEKTEVLVNIQDIHLSEQHWPDPKKFDPERFLAGSTTNRHPFAFIPFSAGPRNCIGQRFAMLEMKIVLVGILSSFVLLAEDTPDTVVHTVDLVNRTQNGIKVKFRRLDNNN